MKKVNILKSMAWADAVFAVEGATTNTHKTVNELVDEAKKCLDGEVTVGSIIHAGGLLLRAGDILQKD